MSFESEFTFCMHGAGLPTPAEALTSAEEVLHFLEEFHNAAELAGGTDVTLTALEAAGFTGLGTVAAEAGAVTAAAYAGAVAGCLLAATGSTVWDLLAQTGTDQNPAVVHDVVVAANDAGVAVPSEFAVA
ncbi:hypothetical protein SAMN04490357_2669 [Streptomyces misionensis]|uniref:Uncharacterized protein n=1 Tax=Streptomyces misionensis TaxID=67331 RepID=A0A1H4UNQ7_9ACTN|nr:hypothetical protein [Streptomyces misionensis]SEC69941.1 hypothetical protein SAMN04490357_2669 [Streptomyces misionensis]